jgi:hypothetical protein
VRTMGVYEEIFPSERRREYVQTEWAEGWTAGASGFGYAAEFLTRHAASFGATIDQAGLAVFFLQRHRVELVLKHLLGFLEVKFKPNHSLGYLWGLCEGGFAGNPDLDWAEFEARNGEFVAALVEVDDGAATFRFPVDQEGKQIERPAYIDLEALNSHADQLYSDAGVCMDLVGEARSAAAEFADHDAPGWGDL